MTASGIGSSHVDVAVTINGERVSHTVPARLLLSDFIRDVVGLTGTHVGCEHGFCGACTIMVNGDAIRSCSTLAAQVDGSTIRTVEDLATDGQLSPMQQAFHENHAMQCGFCTTGFLMTLESVDAKDYQEHDQVIELLSGNLCRCTGYQNIVTAVTSVWHGEEAGG
jgi:aerobic-type carbon monoxide dehydrogenase small subunit (CoxS/CutS family)